MSLSTPISENILQGVWRRDWIEANGQRSDTTQVLWSQAGNLFVNIRIPPDRPDISRHSCLANLSESDLYLLRTAEGFAGHTTLEESVCTWHRETNWQGPPTDIDAGTLSFDDKGALIETGIHADYAERWQKIIDSPVTAIRFTANDLQGNLIVSDNHFAMGVGVPISGVDNTLGNNDSATPHAQFFRSEYVYGHWEGGNGIADLHTNPFCENTIVLTKLSGQYVWHSIDYHGNSATTTLQP